MDRLRRLVLAYVPVTVLSLLVTGCVTGPDWYQAYRQPYRAHPDLSSRAKGVRTLALVPPDIKVYELTAGGVTELRDEWSAKGRENVRRGLLGAFRARGIAVKPLPDGKAGDPALEEVGALYRAVSSSIIEHTYQAYPFPAKLQRFDYSVGSLDALLDRHRADGLVIAYGIDQISTGGRKALRAVGLVLGAFTGQPVLSKGTTAVSIALVDRSGTVLWYRIEGSDGGFDLRDPESAGEFVSRLAAGFPEVGR